MQMLLWVTQQKLVPQLKKNFNRYSFKDPTLSWRALVIQASENWGALGETAKAKDWRNGSCSNLK